MVFGVPSEDTKGINIIVERLSVNCNITCPNTKNIGNQAFEIEYGGSVVRDKVIDAMVDKV